MNAEHFKIMYLEPSLIRYESKGLFETKRHPTDVEVALGIFLDEVDPLVRHLVSELSLKGYNPTDSCQGHLPHGNAHIRCGIALTQEAYGFLVSRGVFLDPRETEEVTDPYCPDVTLYIPHRFMDPDEFLAYTISLAEGLPELGKMIYLDDPVAQVFRETHGFTEIRLPRERVSVSQCNPLHEMENTDPILYPNGLVSTLVF